MKTATRTRSRDDRPDEQSLGLGASRRRMVALAFLVATLILASVFRIFQLQTSEREHFAAQAAELQVKSRQIYQKRGPIVDRAGGLLAQTIESCGIAIRKPVDGDGEACRSRDPVVQDLEAIVAFVAGLTGEDSDTLRRRASCRGCYCYLVRNASPALGDAIREVVGWKPEDPDAPDTNRIALQKALSGLVVEPEATRFYVGRELAGQILGAASFPDPEYLRERGRTAPIRFELQGRLGIELSYDEQLKGIPLEARGLKVRGGGTSYIFEFPELKPTGNTVVLSIDSRIQAVLEEAIDAALRRYQARWGLIIVQDVHTGELLGMAQAPLYNPNAGSSYKGN
ncbi:MAG: hypothetical protein FJ098_14820, partial [Deltaproteobacteria bacterium]|nr:hypothetical protein [Deltaproteobacteria bacterium]